jgi:predicted metal-dependent hydrolase
MPRLFPPANDVEQGGNWKVIIAPNRMVDYLVVHELCHLKQHNHSPKFWKCVESVFPDYQVCKEWLKANGRELQI